MPDAVILLSGGLDSAALFATARDVGARAVFVDYGQLLAEIDAKAPADERATRYLFGTDRA